MCALSTLYLGRNKLSGELVEVIHNLFGCVQHSIGWLDLDGNQIKGSMPESIGNLYVMSVVELVNLVKSFLLILGIIADFLIPHTANLNLLLYI
jgi:hypothetical protein